MTRPESTSTNSPEESSTPPGMNPTWDRMKRDGIPLTAKNYLERAYGRIPDHLGPEEIAELPEEIREAAEDLVISRSPDATPENSPERKRVISARELLRLGVPAMPTRSCALAAKWLTSVYGQVPIGMPVEKLCPVPSELALDVLWWIVPSPGAKDGWDLLKMQYSPDPAERAVALGVSAAERRRPN